MTDVQFEEENMIMDRGTQPDRRTAFIKFIMSTGLAKTEKTANYILIASMLIFFGLAIYIFKNFAV